jgi:hypothetical protein
VSEQLEEQVLVTDDSRFADGVLDPDDRVMLRQIAPDGRHVKIITNAEMYAEAARRRRLGLDDVAVVPGSPALDRVEPPNPDMITLTPELMRSMAAKGSDRYTEFTADALLVLTVARAREVRAWRVGRRLTWRAVARRAANLWRTGWAPPSNQIAGMALCREAAALLGEDYREPPWNDAPRVDPADLEALR